MKMSTTILAGTTLLAALVVVFDYAAKYLGLKVPFPWFPILKFDFTGIPIVLSLLLFDLIPGAFTSAIAVLAILARSGDFVGSSMKGLAEFLTILGMFLGLKMVKRLRLPTSFFLGIGARALTMMIANFALIYTGLLQFTQSYSEVPLTFVMFTGVFNVIQGAISIAGGYLTYMAVKRRIPSMIKDMEGF
jgi:riboflavin transporter FmnP